jgi:hypothetical protein
MAEKTNVNGNPTQKIMKILTGAWLHLEEYCISNGFHCFVLLVYVNIL